ncbi:hypothetical protein [Bradyrhizobium sp. RT11b]|uniref:alpha/beta hydrolase family protein n=1 Tax=Bradyrhizobium sp. RT11b TaxID=3156332 RepID=UPI003397A5E6
MSGNLASTRRGATAFLDNLSFSRSPDASDWREWGEKWARLGDYHFQRGAVNSAEGAIDKARDACLCALTAFEVARRLVDPDSSEIERVSANIEAGVQRVGSTLEQKLEKVLVEYWDQSELPGYYLSSSAPAAAPAVICISKEDEPVSTLMGRLLPLIIGRNVAILAVSHEDVSSHSSASSKLLLSSCLDFLSGQAKVDANRIGVYGEGLSASIATDFAAWDSRVAAAVCDGGLWNWARMLASIDWITRAEDRPKEDAFSARRSEQVRRLKCPILVVAGGRGTASLSEAIKLQHDCAAADVDMELTIPKMSSSPVGEVENFLTSDDYIFRWLEHKLGNNSCPYELLPK